MKCSYCGNELENSAEFCPQCGMILGIDSSKDSKDKDGQEEVFRVPEYIPNVFTPVEQETEEEETARQLEANPEEEIVPVTENIPEYVSSVPEDEPLQIEEESEEIPEETEEVYEEAEGISEEETDETAEETGEAEAESAEEESAEEPAEETEAGPEEAEESREAYEETPAEPEQAETLQVEEIDEPVYEDFKEETQNEDGVLLGITVPDEEISYPEYEDYNAKNKEESITPEEEQYEDITDYVPAKKKKSAKGFTVVLLIAIICVVVGGLYMTDNLPVFSNAPTTETTEADTTETTEADTTEEDTTEKDTTEEDTTEEDTTEEDTTEELTEETTTVPSTTEATTQATTSATTTTRPQTTTATQTTTAAATTRPQTTTSATTTERYGINDVEVKKPSSFYSKTKTLYCTAEGVILRSGPATSYDRVLYLSKGADLTVLAEEDGFYYVKSNRYGVYGWVSASYVSSSRNETEETKVYSGTVKPDKYYEDAEVKYAVDGLNMRKGPGTDYSVITVIIKNYPVKVIGYSSENSGWVYVTDTTYGISGWVNSAYLK